MLHFSKMQGIGNDFAVLDALRHPLLAAFDFARAAQTLCARHSGVGGDGMLLLSEGENAPIQMRMWNPDGTEDMCGNGLRCIAWLAYERGYTGEEFSCDTLAGTRRCAIVGQNRVRVGMGVPHFAPEAVPITLPPDASPLYYSLTVGGETLRAVSLSTGSTHTVLFCDELPHDARFFHLSPLIEGHVNFPQRTSVMWARAEGEGALQLRIWERGAGETLACGTGAGAAAVAAILTGRAQGPVRVRSKGGELLIAWREGAEIEMTGAAHAVFEGEWPGDFTRESEG